MADESARSRLGRGLAALMGDVGGEAQAVERGRTQRRVPVEFLHANPRNPRKSFSDAELTELADSIRERGVIQPIVVRGRGGDKFEIIAGERRWRAAQRAGLHEVPIVVLDVNDGEALELAIIENVQRADLNAIEEATGYQSLVDEFKHSADDIAKIVGKSRSHIANTLRLLKLSDAVKAYIHSGQLTAGHARALIGQPNVAERRLDNPVHVPGVLSFLAYGTFHSNVAGLDAFPPEDWPDNIELLYYAFHVMAGLGTLMIGLMTLAAWLLWRDRLHATRPVLWALMLAFPFPYIATTAGWITAELGRQPWVVYGLLRTKDAASPSVSGGTVLFTLIGFTGLYFVLGLLFVYLVGREVTHGPAPRRAIHG